MAEVLSQSQIDALLKGLSTGDVSTEDTTQQTNDRKIKNYDFYSPKKFTKEQLRTMDSLHENLCRLLTNYFSAVLRVAADVQVEQIEEQRYYEYNNALPDTALIGLVDMRQKKKAAMNSTLMVDMSTNVGYFTVDRLLGGSGDGHNLNRNFSDIEIALLTNVYQKVTGYIQDSWADYLEVQCNLDSLETNPRLLQVYAPEDIVVIVVLSVKLRDVEGNISISIPGLGLEEMMGEFTSKYTRTNRKFTDENREKRRREVISDTLYGSDLNVTAVFHQTELELADILRLRVDDIIPLNKAVSSQVNLHVDNVPWFSGKLGVSKNHKAVKITGIYKH